MFSVPHLVVLFIVVLVFFGPHKLPELARGLGKLMAEFRKASNDFKMAFEEEMRNIERQNREAEWKKSQEETEAKRQKELASSPPGEEAGSEPKILPEHSAASASDAAEPMEPTVAPVSEAVARDSDALEIAAENSPRDFAPAEEATGSDSIRSSEPEQPSSQPSHQSAQKPNDQRQPA
ncbi:MAG TPA: twin-arginine translocase TatA/TatE family subunit [Candidatus Acidoferrum sp.]|nr:twin-arginine translocase TatA/TatE family subunit [Candidatus Acidoferrum sp.]